MANWVITVTVPLTVDLACACQLATSTIIHHLEMYVYLHQLNTESPHTELDHRSIRIVILGRGVFHPVRHVSP